MNTCHIYLSGSIKKGTSDMRDSFWTEVDIHLIREFMQPVPVNILNPSIRADDITDARSACGHDLFQVLCSDFVLVDARDRRGLGVGVEMAFATFQRIPVVILGKEQSHYFRDSLVYLGQRVQPFVHPFVCGMASYIGFSLKDVSTFMKEQQSCAVERTSGSSRCTDAMKHYIRTNLCRDHVMQAMVSNNERIRQKCLSFLTETELREIMQGGDQTNSG